jgi:hypothetical protein
MSLRVTGMRINSAASEAVLVMCCCGLALLRHR